MIAVLMSLALFVFGAKGQSLEAARYFESGIKKIEVGQNADALLLLSKAKKVAERSQASPEFRAMIHYNIGVVFYRIGDASAAEHEYRTALRLKNGRYEKAVYALGVIRSERRIDSARAMKQ
jgi:Tfp pilus assembly protein PilF